MDKKKTLIKDSKIPADKMFDIVEYHRKRERKRRKFYEEKKYLNLIDTLMNRDIDSDDYREPSEWTNEIDEMFSFLYDNAYALLPFDEEVVVRHNNAFISLFEMHGQGCYRRISKVKKEPREYVLFDDIVRYFEAGEKPYKNKVLETINQALDTLEVALKGVDNNYLDVDDVREYIKENLN